jgi:hypothetical protein
MTQIIMKPMSRAILFVGDIIARLFSESLAALAALAAPPFPCPSFSRPSQSALTFRNHIARRSTTTSLLHIIARRRENWKVVPPPRRSMV